MSSDTSNSFPMFKKANCSLVSSELVSVAPMSAPSSGNLFYMDFEYGSLAIRFYPVLVNAENLKQVKEDFFRDDVMIGDVIAQDNFESLKGEKLLRDGVKLDSRILDRADNYHKSINSKITTNGNC